MENFRKINYEGKLERLITIKKKKLKHQYAIKGVNANIEMLINPF